MPEPVFFSLTREISPPPPKGRRKRYAARNQQDGDSSAPPPPALAAVEAGEAQVRDHLAYFSAHLAARSRPMLGTSPPRISIEEFKALYQRNQDRHGRHFVVHQHNHPVAGVHYDLRLQFSRTSCVSWAIPYGLPGNAGSRRQGRMAVETRVHCLWNNLIESASHATGSLLIWDTGEYEVLDRHPPAVETDDEEAGVDWREPENERLVKAFQSAYIRLRLHGTRLPQGYTVTLRLPPDNNIVRQPRGLKRKRRRADPSSGRAKGGSQSSDEQDSRGGDSADLEESAVAAAASDDENGDDARIREENAYTGATNSIGSVHQRRWHLSLDKANSGFVKVRTGDGRGVWRRRRRDGGDDDSPAGFEAFFVGGVEVERSVVTGRLSEEIMADEGVQGFVARKMWRPVLD
ncbi:DNA polymerase ligase-domain-containing protein [Macrophomina phaseolina]|uniref:DNA polymerase ligase-domain-containing protein n=1 Tax=Macrophomina phaseolina TaxID=35725 RepID=A0ABQ8G9M1_9PEZI|nr:DNA polymerase ligase-domain-containing protein [Macrophomina phaseolina]